MTQYEIYTFILCLIVFVALTALFTSLLTYIVKLWVRLIRGGEEDETIVREYESEKTASKRSELAAQIFSGVICVLFCLCFVFSIYLRTTENKFSDRMPSLQVVKSGSMSYKYEENSYLYLNELDDQIGTFDMIVVHPLPEEEELELYNIVVYEVNNRKIVHRIVGIEEPNEGHPEDRYFLLQGDAVESPDKFPVLYSQMRGIYRGQHVPMVGSFVSFLQSPAGWLCILLILFAMIATPLVDKRIATEKRARLTYLGIYGPNPGAEPWEEPAVAVFAPLPAPKEPPEWVRCPLEKKPLVARFHLKKGDVDMLSCLYSVEQVRVRVDQAIPALAPFAAVRYGKAPLAKVTMKGKRLEVQSASSEKKRINVLFRQGAVPVAKLVLKDRSLRVYLNLDSLKYPGAKLMPGVVTTRTEDLFQIHLRLSYPGKTKPVKKLVLSVEKTGLVTIKEES